ncbi:MAG: pentapeptide repeat-containing protein [Acetobacteraceae bacterium]|nr:pentapeptide repeat-containing protein [Acetobacteraceae bacterium]
MRRSIAILMIAVPALLPVPARANEKTATDVPETLAAATPEHPANFAGASLQKLDLSGFNFTRANLSGADLFGAKLVGADFTEANLSGAHLNLAWIIRANFTRADLSHASLKALVVSEGLETKRSEVANFTGAKLRGAQVQARFSLFDMRGADFSGAHMAADMRNQSMGLMRTEFAGADLRGANFMGADLGHAVFSFARLGGANLSGANLAFADFSGADLTGADLTGADATAADFRGATLTGAKGLATVKGPGDFALDHR